LDPKVAWVISLGSVLIWVLIPFRQWKTFFFSYFLVLAVSDPAGYLLNYLFRIPFLLTYVTASWLSLIVLFSKDILKKYLPYLLSFTAILVIFCYFYVYDGAIEIIFFVIHLLILLRLSFLLILYVARNQAISVFYLLLVFYEAIVLSKFVNNFTNFADGVFYFIFSTAVQILVGIFFLIYKEDSDRIVFQLK